MTEQSIEQTTNPLIDIFAKFNLTLDSLSNQIKQQQLQEQLRLASQPNTLTLFNIVTVPGSGNLVMDFGSPQNGRVWHVRHFLALRSNFTSGTVTTSLYIGTNVQSAITSWGLLPIGNLRRQYASIPAQDKFSPGELQIYAQEHLMVEFLGAASASQIFCSFTINDEPLKRATPVIEA